MRSATTDSRNVQNYAHRHNHSFQNTEEEPIASGTTADAPAAHMRCLSPPAAATLFFSFLGPASSPKHSPCNIHAAIPMRSATTASRNTENYAHRNNHSLQNTEEEPKRPQPQPPHTGGTFHPRPKPLYTEKRTGSCCGFLPKP